MTYAMYNIRNVTSVCMGVHTCTFMCKHEMEINRRKGCLEVGDRNRKSQCAQRWWLNILCWQLILSLKAKCPLFRGISVLFLRFLYVVGSRLS